LAKNKIDHCGGIAAAVLLYFEGAALNK